ncbi:disease resistance protein RUN1-like [Vicia villosa]|uniref:disease resistance protein RUN1-like n=1 Tax=Vicia villosa TaxID=3911 RepID=UPI00273AF782|nr:disease resistance protein RUN1-like [Vicia villosa]
MASSSRNSSTLALRNYYYDVFVSFRGEDTRYNFTDFLFHALQTQGIFAFRDDNNLPKGESIRPELLHAIQHSQVYVVVFSTNYASSTWCLQELEKICECVQMSGKHVLPVFYDVDPSDVRHQRGIYAEAFSKHEHRFQHDSQMVSRWREALTQVANLSGWDLRHKPQSAAIKEIVQKIINILDCKSSCVSNDLVGMDSPIQELENLLLLDSVDDVRVVGICGMGGIGKTTLATVLFDQISQQFGACCFIDDVTKIYRLHDGPLGVQKQILDQTLGQEHHQICNHYNATNLIRRRLCRQRAFIILDNVGQVEQLEKIAVRREWLGAGSRIIIISRDEHILKHYGVDAIYQVPLLDWPNSLQLLCQKAFKLDHILSSYEGLVNDLLSYADGLPLAINVLGSFLFGRDVSEWRSALDRLRENPDKDVMDVLQLSFDGLRETEKEIFLHIACFFNMHMEKYVKNVVNCFEFHADIGLRVLIDKSLVSTENEMIVMHNLLEELGRNIIAKNTSKEPREWTRLWLDKQLYDVMLENMEKNVEAIVLDHEYKDCEDYEDMDAAIFKDFSNLRLLIFKYVKVSGSLNHLSNKLRYIEWSEYPFMYLPSSFQPNQLVELKLKDSSIKQLWEGKKNLPKLRILDLSHSKNLIKMPNFAEFPNLERLNLKGCIKLVQLDPSIGLLIKLVSLNLKDCQNLVSLPSNITGLSSLKDLNMSGCYGCFKEFNKTWHLNICESASHSQSMSSIYKWATKPYHSLLPTPMTKTVMFPSFLSLYCLLEVDISYCDLSQLPKAIGCLRWLEMLNLRGNNFVTLPSLRELSKLVCLNLESCKRLESLPELPFPTSIKQDLRKSKYRARTGLFIFNCPKISDKERCSRLTFSWMTQFIQVNKEYPAFFYIGIVIPGSNIPSWVSNQSIGNSIPVSPVMQDNCNNIVGILCCVVFSLAPHYPTMTSSSQWRPLIVLCAPLSHDVWLPVIVDGDLITVKSNHIWLVYIPRECSYDVPLLYNLFQVLTISNEGVDVEVKKCGYRWVYEQDLQEFNLTTMHPGNMLALKRKFLAIEDEAQPQLHSFR